MTEKPEKDELSGVETTGHEWDGLKELNNPAPRWWLWVFLVCCVWAFGYWIYYPTWPTTSGNSKGSLGWTSHKELNSSQQEIVARQQKYMDKFHGKSLADVKADNELYEFARAGGAAAFKNYCSACHGTGAAGGKGYPNLNDDDWIFGGKLDDIYKTIQVGSRSGHPNARGIQMPAFGGVLKADEISDTAEYVVHLHDGDKAEQTPAFVHGKQVFATNCAACHGANGEGNRDMGAPRLNDNIWLYGGTKEDVVNQINKPRLGVMPTWEGKLDDDTIKQLTIYVHSLGGGE